MSTSRTKLQSPYPGLQSILSRLSALNPTHSDRKVFDSREEAENYIAKEGNKDLQLNAVWAVDHSDLQASQIRGWSYTEYPC
jgi:hypothetical protein